MAATTVAAVAPASNALASFITGVFSGAKLLVDERLAVVDKGTHVTAVNALIGEGNNQQELTLRIDVWIGTTGTEQYTVTWQFVIFGVFDVNSSLVTRLQDICHQRSTTVFNHINRYKAASGKFFVSGTKTKMLDTIDEIIFTSLYKDVQREWEEMNPISNLVLHRQAASAGSLVMIRGFIDEDEEVKRGHAAGLPHQGVHICDPQCIERWAATFQGFTFTPVAEPRLVRASNEPLTTAVLDSADVTITLELRVGDLLDVNREDRGRARVFLSIVDPLTSSLVYVNTKHYLHVTQQVEEATQQCISEYRRRRRAPDGEEDSKQRQDSAHKSKHTELRTRNQDNAEQHPTATSSINSRSCADAVKSFSIHHMCYGYGHAGNPLIVGIITGENETNKFLFVTEDRGDCCELLLFLDSACLTDFPATVGDLVQRFTFDEDLGELQACWQLNLFEITAPQSIYHRLPEDEEASSHSDQIRIEVEQTRAVKMKMLMSDSLGAADAVYYVLQRWKDKRETQDALMMLAESGKIGAFDAIYVLGKYWKDEQTRVMLEVVAKSDKKEAVCAVDVLIEHWMDKQTRDVLEELAKSDKSTAETAVRALVERWKDEQTRGVLLELAKSDTRTAGSAVRAPWVAKGAPEAARAAADGAVADATDATGPTFNGTILPLFQATPGAIGCMKAQGLDLTDYKQVYERREEIQQRLHSKAMPPGQPNNTTSHIQYTSQRSPHRLNRLLK